MAPIAKMGAQHQQQQQRQQQHQQHQPPVQQQQQQQSPGEHLGKAGATTIVPAVVGIGGGGIRQRTTYSLDDASTSASAAPARSAFLNPWRELDREDFVITYATKGTARCIACASKIGKGELQLGAFYMHEDKFTLVRWYHQRCVEAPECLTNPMDLCGIDDIGGRDLDRVLKWLGYGMASVKDRTWTA